MACGERVLLPKVREASPETLVVADGFSCRSQIEQGSTGRGALHVAEVIKLARDHGSIPQYPERAVSSVHPNGSSRRGRMALAAGAAMAAVAGTALAVKTFRS
jgi:hypothetical protein